MSAVVADTPDAPTNEYALAAIVGHEGPVLLEFDETIYLGSSTEDFIDSARPALLALLIMRLLDAIRPWRWTGGEVTRDVWRVRAIMMLFPWTRKYWPRRARTLARTGANAPLIETLRKRAESKAATTVIAASGFDFIVAPLCTALGLPALRIIAARATTFADRRAGRLRMVASRVGHEAVRRAIVMTGAKQNDSLLEGCAVPLRVEWVQTPVRVALSNRYLPGQYVTFIKRPGERYLTRTILQEDFALWVLATIGLSSQPFAHVAALACLLLSFWSIYECGHVDADELAARRADVDGKRTSPSAQRSIPTPKILPWIWALLGGAAGVAILRGFNLSALWVFGVWNGVLLATYGLFVLHNRADVQTRPWTYGGLQVLRSAAIFAVAPVLLVGSLAIGADVAARWMAFTYAKLEKEPPVSYALARLLFFVLLCAFVALSAGVGVFAGIWGAALLLWAVVCARTALAELILHVRAEERVAVTRPAPAASSVDRGGPRNDR
jgi:hypothetical protein